MGTRVAQGIILTSIVAAIGTTASPIFAATTKTENVSTEWMTMNKAAKTVTLKVIADASTTNDGYNFNGYNTGTMNVEVPLGWTVRVSFQNQSPSIPHSLMIVPFAQRNLESGFSPALTGAYLANPTHGLLRGKTQSFQFKATKTGNFAMVCAVPGHSEGGMWDKFTISTKIKSPAVFVTESVSSTGSSGGGWY